MTMPRSAGGSVPRFSIVGMDAPSGVLAGAGVKLRLGGELSLDTSADLVEK
jgi:hypothetical protein